MVRRLAVPIVLAVVALGAGIAALRADADAAPEPYADAPDTRPAVITPVLSARRVPELTSVPTAERDLASRLESALAVTPSSTCLVVDHGDRPVLDHNPDLPLAPASTLKLVTAAAALDRLGGDDTFQTTALGPDTVDDGLLGGDLWLVGGGDPVLSTDDYLAAYDEPRVGTDLEALADALVAAGLREVTGGVLGDETRYDAQRYVEVWPDRYEDQNQTGPLSALSLNDGFERYPTEDFAGPLATPAGQPAAHAASVLDDLLEARGVVIRGSPGQGVAPADLLTLATVDSPLLDDILDDMLSASDNTTAELLVKELGVHASDEGSTVAGTSAVLDWVGAEGLSTAGVSILDGSGLAPDDRLTCDLLVELLDGAEPGTPLTDGLAVAGERGTLRGRYVDTPIEGRLRAKTGSLRDATTLAGFYDVAPGDVLTFALLINRESIDFFSEALPWQDAVVNELAAYPSGVDLVAISPVPVTGGTPNAPDPGSDEGAG